MSVREDLSDMLHALDRAHLHADGSGWSEPDWIADDLFGDLDDEDYADHHQRLLDLMEDAAELGWVQIKGEPGRLQYWPTARGRAVVAAHLREAA